MFAKWFVEYQNLSQKTLFVSRMAAFLISIFAFLSLSDIARFFYFNPSSLGGFFDVHLLSTAVVFQLLILFVFVSRFALLFVNSRRASVYRLILLVVGLILLAAYLYLSIPREAASGIYSTGSNPIFRHASSIFGVVGICYLILSPLRQITTIITALIKSK
jgi:uncharacterized membrane-anchored protein